MLKGRRVCLGPVEARDSRQLFEWINTPDLVRLNAAYGPIAESSHDRWFASLANDSSRVYFAIRTLSDGKLIGTVQLAGIHPVHRHAEMAVRIGAETDRGRGLGTEVLRLLLDFAWRDLNLRRVTALVFTGNARAIACYRKAGFVDEGRLRDGAFIDGKWVQLVVMGALNPAQN